MAEELPPLVASIVGDAADLLSTLTEATAALTAFARQDFTANLGLNIDGLLAKAEAAQTVLDDLGSKTSTPQINGDDAGLDAAIARAQIAIASLAQQAVNIPIDGDDNPFLATVAELHAMVEEPVDIPIDATGLKSIMAQILATRGAMAALKTDMLLAGTEAATITEADLMSMDAINSAIRDTQVARIGAQALVDGAIQRIASGGGGAGGGTSGPGGGGAGTFLGTLLGSGGAKGIAGFGTPLLPRIPLAGFGTLGSMGGLGLESIVGLGAGLVGFAAHGLLGGMALGLTSLGVSAAGMGTDMAGIGQAFGDVKQYGQLQGNLNQAAAVYGKGSTEYAAAQYAYNQWSSTLSPAYVAAVSKTSAAKTQFGALFDKYTGPAATTGANILTQGLGVADTFLPTIGKFAAENMTIVQKALQPLFTWLQGPGLKAFTQIEQVFTDHLPTAMHAFDQAIELVIKTVAHFAPQTGGLLNFFDKLFTKLNGPGFTKFIGEVQRAIDAFRVWEKFGKAVFDMIDQLFVHDAKTGEAFVETLTHLIDKFNAWAHTVAGGDKLHEYMEAHKQEVIQLVDLFGNLVSIMGQVHLSVGPVLMDLVGDILKLVNALLEIPGINKILSYIIAFEILSRHISILKPLVTAFNGELKKLALQGLVAVGGAISSLGGPFTKLGGWMQGLGTTAPTDIEKAATAMQSAADQMAESAAQISEAFSGVSTAATGAAADVEKAAGSMDLAMATTATDAEVSAAKVDAAMGSEGIAGDLGGAGLAEGALAGGGLAEGGLLAGGGAGLLSKTLPGLGTGAIGLLGVQLYNMFGEKKLSHVIGTNAASALGDVGTGAAIGTMFAPGIGTALGAAAGAAFAERSGLNNIAHSLFGDTASGKGGAAAQLRAEGFNVPNALIPKPTQTQQVLAKDSTLQKELAAINLLKGNVAAAKAKDGADSSQYKAALKALDSTQKKYLPTLGKNESLTKVASQIALVKGGIAISQSAQHTDQLIGNDKLAGAEATLKTMKANLATEKTGKASKDAIDLAKEQVKTATAHLDVIKGYVSDGAAATKEIKTDTSQLSKLTALQSAMQKVNSDTSTLHTDLKPLSGAGINIAKLPSQKWKVLGGIQLKVS